MPNTFAEIEAGAHGGAFGNNPIPTPTDAQCKAGNYKLGRITLQGMSIAIEQPRGTYRTGMDADGKRWSSRMAAHYGYFADTRGNDGDEVDCFVGFYAQSELAFVVNQNVASRFDEHKVMLAFPDEESARRAYTDSYERGWPGLASIVPASISQLKWWLKNGNMTRPLKPEHLPHEGLEAMTQRTQWNADALPYDQTLDQVLYDIRRSDGGDGLLLDSVSMADILEDSDGAYIFDAMVVPMAGLERKMGALQRVMERASQTVKPVALQVTEPFTQRGVANVAAIFKLSDGQTVSIYFHNPDVTPKKMAPTDELISWKWLLNKKDITIVVAPEHGEDLNVNEVARRIMKLAEKNSAAFVRANGKRAESMQRLADLNTEIAGLETELKAAQNDLEAAKIEAEDRAAQSAFTSPDALRALADKLQASQEQIKADSLANGVSQNTTNEAMTIASTNLILGHFGQKFGAEVQNREFVKSKFGELGFSGKAYIKDFIDRYATPAPVTQPTPATQPTAQADYERLSAQNPGAILLYRMGDFYEVLGKDAAAVAGVLELTLTKRMAAGGGAPVPMAGFAAHALARNIEALKGAGYAVAVAERGADGVAQIVQATPAVVEPPAPASTYEFTDATDTFKQAATGGGSDFATAEKMDAKAKELGLKVSWSTGKALLDSAAGEMGDEGEDDEDDEDNDGDSLDDDLDFDAEEEWDAAPELDSCGDEVPKPILDGDFKGHPFHGNQYKKAGHSSRAAVGSTLQAKAIERKGGSKKALKAAHKEAYYSHRAAAVSASSKTKRYHKKMAKFHAKNSGVEVLDSAAIMDAATGPQGLIGKVKSGAKIIGRISIGGDGKAMIFTGNAGKERVKTPGGEPAIWADSEAAGLLDYLVAAPASPVYRVNKQAVPTRAVIVSRDDGLGNLTVHVQADYGKGLQTAFSGASSVAEAQKMIESQGVSPDAITIRNEVFDVKLKRFVVVAAAPAPATPNGETLIYALKAGETERYTESLMAAIPNNEKTQENIDRVIATASKDGWHSFRFAGFDPSKPPVFGVNLLADPTPAPAPAPAGNPAKTADTAYLQSLVDGTADIFAPDVYDRIEVMATKYADDSELMALLERAAEAYGNAAIAAAQAALANK